MKRTILVAMTIVMVAVVMIFATPVNAAELTSNAAKTTKKGDTVEVSLKTTEPVGMMEFSVKYDTDAYKYVKTTTEGAVVGDNNGVAKATYSSLTKDINELVLVFEVIADESVADASFELVPGKTILGTSDGADVDEAVTTDSVDVPVAIEEPTTPDTPTTPEEPTTPETPGNQEEPATPETPADTEKPSSDDKQVADNDKTYVDDDGNEITKIKQAGVYTPAIAFAVVALAVVALAAYRIMKK